MNTNYITQITAVGGAIRPDSNPHRPIYSHPAEIYTYTGTYIQYMLLQCSTNISHISNSIRQHTNIPTLESPET